MLKRFDSYPALAEALFTSVENGTLTTISFDVFDTLVHRRMAAALVLDGVCQVFSDLLTGKGIPLSDRPLLTCRREAYEGLVARHVLAGLDPDTTIDELAPAWVQKAVGQYLSSIEIAQMGLLLASAEVEIERRVCFANPWLKELLPRLKSLGARVLCISDMYLGEKNVRAILDDCQLLSFIDAVHVSGDVRLLKRSGRLFDHVAQTCELSSATWLHVGDNFHADGLMANSRGTRAWIINDRLMHEEARRQEFDVDAYRADPSWAGLIAAGYAHAPTEMDSPQEQVFGRRVLGPIFAGFVHRLVERCKQTGVGQIYFFAREGHLLRQLYLKMAPLAFPDGSPPATYLAISRLTALLAAMHGYGIREFTAAMANTSHHSVRSLLAPLCVGESLLKSVAARNGITNVDAAIPGTVFEYAPLMHLVDDPELAEHIVQTGTQARELLLAYLAQEGFFNHQRVAVVDLGWGAQIQDSLYSSVRSHPRCPLIFGFYLGANGQAAWRHCAQSRIEGLLADYRDPHWSASSAFEFVYSLEAAARAPHGTTLGYIRDNDGKILPIFRDSNDPSRQAEIADEAFICHLQIGILSYVEQYRQCAAILRFSDLESLPYARTMLERLIRYPNRQEIIWWQRLSNVADLGSSSADRLGGSSPRPTSSLFSVFSQWRTSPFHYGLIGLAAGRIGQLLLSVVKAVRSRRRYKLGPTMELPALPLAVSVARHTYSSIPEWERTVDENFARILAEAPGCRIENSEYRVPRLTLSELLPIRLGHALAFLLFSLAGARLPRQEAPSLLATVQQQLYVRYNLRARASLLIRSLRLIGR